MRQKCDLRPAAKPKRLPRVLTADQFRAFYKAVDEADDVQHALMLRLLFYTGVRVSELCAIEVADVDLGELQDLRQPGEGVEGPVRLVRQVLRHRAYAPTSPPILRTAGCSRPAMRSVFDQAGASRSSSSMPSKPASMRPRICSGIRRYSFLTKTSGLADAELQLITGHARRETLAIYQHVAVDGQLADKYQAAMRDVGL